MSLNLPGILTIAILLTSYSPLSTSADKIYKWTDNDGKVHYSDKPHKSEQLKNANGGETKVEEVKVQAGPSAKQKEQASQREQQIKSTAESIEAGNKQRAAEQTKNKTSEKKSSSAGVPKEEPAGGESYDPRFPLRPRPPIARPPVGRPVPSIPR